MHMPDHILSPQVALAMGGASLVALGYTIQKLRHGLHTVEPLQSASVAACIFVIQMLNVTIPGTTASGHIIGAALAVALLGRYMALLVMVAVVSIQALFFADGGLMALGANLFNMAVLPCLVLAPVLNHYVPETRALLRTSVLAALSVVIGALAVCGEMFISHGGQVVGSAFLQDMVIMHALVGVMEVVVTALLVMALQKNPKPLWFVSLAAVGLVFSHGASQNPDALEWSLERMMFGLFTTGSGQGTLTWLQKLLALAPDYQLPMPGGTFLAGSLGALLVALFVFVVHQSRRSSPL